MAEPLVRSFRLYVEVAQVWEQLLVDCARAKHSIEVEQYLVGGAFGRALLSLLAERAHQGVRVRVLADAFGSMSLTGSQALADLRASGAEFIAYNRLPFRLHRTHRKAVVVDDAIAYVGGACFIERVRPWHDAMVRLAGPIARTVRLYFDATWQRALDAPKARVDGMLAAAEAGQPQDSPWRYMVNEPRRARWLSLALLHRIDGAGRSIRLTTPYLYPSRALLRRIKAARRRGVTVQIIVPVGSDYSVVDLLGRLFAVRLRGLGCEVRYYRPAMLHAKVALVDGTWAMVSSHNLDHLSLLLNLENGLVSTDPAFVAEIDRFYHDCLGQTVTRPAAVPGWLRSIRPLAEAFVRRVWQPLRTGKGR